MTPIHPSINAVLNFSSALLLAAGFFFVKRGNIEAHRKAMSGAFLVSSVFLISYLAYHYTAGATKYQGPWRSVYLTILLTHTVLAAVTAPLAIATFWRGLNGRVAEHKRLARFTWPIWIYVSVTGVVIYWMLYQM